MQLGSNTSINKHLLQIVVHFQMRGLTPPFSYGNASPPYVLAPAHLLSQYLRAARQVLADRKLTGRMKLKTRARSCDSRTCFFSGPFSICQVGFRNNARVQSYFWTASSSPQTLNVGIPQTNAEMNLDSNKYKASALWDVASLKYRANALQVNHLPKWPKRHGP